VLSSKLPYRAEILDAIKLFESIEIVFDLAID